MLSIQVIRDNREALINGLLKRNWSEEGLQVLDQVIELDDQRKDIQTRLDSLLAERNQLSKSIGELFKSGQAAEANAMKDKVSNLKTDIEQLQAEADQVGKELREALLTIPNLPNELVPKGNTDADNVEVRAWGKPLPELPADALPHWDLAEKYNLIDFKIGVELSGSGFALFRARGARLERALISFFLDEATKAGYEEIIPPLLVNETTAFGTGQLPDKEGQMYCGSK